MSEVTENDVNVNVESPLDSIRKQADNLGIKYHHKAGVAKIEKLIYAHNNPTPAPTIAEAKEPVRMASTVAQPPFIATPVVKEKETPSQHTKRKHREANKLVRVMITCMNPNKKDWEGEVFTVANRIIGTIKKYVPFNREFHVPMAIFKMIQQRKCQIFKRERNGGKVTSRPMLIKEFGINVLPNLTQDELVELAKTQAAAGVIG